MGYSGPIKQGRAQDWRNLMISRFPETGLPGYWKGLEQNCAQWAEEVTVSQLWKSAESSLPAWRTSFNSEYGGGLLSQPGLPSFVGKMADRIEEKIAIRCAGDRSLIEELYPTDCNGVPRLNDLVRTRIRCRFVEGVEFLANKLVEHLRNHSVEPERSREGRIQGYFAQHITFPYSLVYRVGGATSVAVVNVEVQVATELSSRVWEATHSIYEDSRSGKDDPAEWQWNPRDPRYVSRQLGHTIHLADGLLSQLRDYAETKLASTGKGDKDDK